ncbi:hypothetical protein Dimus_007954, partial [Dionaea muscipula]
SFAISGELAPPTRLPRDGPEVWIRVLPERCARKRKSERLLPRSLLENMKRATTEEGEFRVQVACRRSCRLSHSLPFTVPDLEVVLEDELSPIAEVVEAIEELRPPVAASDGGQVGHSGVVVDGLSGVADGPIHGEGGVRCTVADEV